MEEGEKKTTFLLLDTFVINISNLKEATRYDDSIKCSWEIKLL